MNGDLRTLLIIKSVAPSVISDSWNFKGWRYTTVKTKFDPTGEDHSVCIDLDCTISLIDIDFLKQHLPNVTVHKMKNGVTVRGLGQESHRSNQYVLLSFYFKARDDSSLAHITQELHLVKNLGPKILLDVDILTQEGITLDLQDKTARIGSCGGMIIGINVKQLPKHKRQVYTALRTTVPPRSAMLVAIEH